MPVERVCVCFIYILVCVKELYEAEEKRLLEMKKTLTGLEEKQEYNTAFIQKILSTEGQSILLHKKQVRVFCQEL